MSNNRLPICIEAWPECEDGKYDPRCCRFPKSCSCNIVEISWSWYYDQAGYGPYCEGCDARFYPDCDVSSVSTMQEFKRHMAEAHNLYPIDK